MAPEAALTTGALAVALGVAARAAWVDWRTRLIPNPLVGALGATWLLWRLGLGACACWSAQATEAPSGLPGAAARFWQGAWGAQPLGLPDAGAGLLAAVVFGLGLLLLACAFEAVAGQEAFGGGDVKLMAALALFLGLGAGVLCLFVACVASLAATGAARLRSGRGEGASEADVPAAPPGAPFPAGAGERSQGFPFAPALLVGFVVGLAYVAL